MREWFLEDAAFCSPLPQGERGEKLPESAHSPRADRASDWSFPEGGKSLLCFASAGGHGAGAGLEGTETEEKP